MLKNERHPHPLYLTRMVNILFFSFFNLFTSHFKIPQLAMERAVTVDGSCRETSQSGQDAPRVNGRSVRQLIALAEHN